jgi:hypothetical protein
VKFRCISTNCPTITIPCYYYPCISFYSCTYWVPTISILNLVIFPYCPNLLLRRWRWTKIFWRWVLGYALPWLLFLWCYGVFRCSVLFWESHLSLLRYYLCNKYILFVTFVYPWTLFVPMCGTIDPGHTYDEYLVLLAKSGMTEVVLESCQP